MSKREVCRENHRRLVEYFASGAKGAGACGRLGVEVEHHVLTDRGGSVAYEPDAGVVGIREVLAHLAEWYPERTFNSEKDLLGLAGEDGSVTLEPAAQLELSAAPCARVADVERIYRRFRERVDTFLGERGAHLETWGYHPAYRAQELTLIPKRRYDFMDAYFSHIGSHGERMMRASASTQVSVDFTDEADAVRKMRVASALSPVLAAITDNTPVFEREPNHIPIRRLQLWREVDGLRCGTIPGVFAEGFGFEAYADWLLRTPPIFVTRPAADQPEGERLRPFFDVPASEAYSDAPLDDSDVEHLVSMFWPDVRLKRFVEVRPADSLPVAEILGYTALVKGIFYSEASLFAVEQALGVGPGAAKTRSAWPLATSDVESAIAEVQAHGMDGLLYGMTLRAWEDLLFEVARDALDDEEQTYLLPLERFAGTKDFWSLSEA